VNSYFVLSYIINLCSDVHFFIDYNGLLTDVRRIVRVYYIGNTFIVYTNNIKKKSNQI